MLQDRRGRIFQRRHLRIPVGTSTRSRAMPKTTDGYFAQLFGGGQAALPPNARAFWPTHLMPARTRHVGQEGTDDDHRVWEWQRELEDVVVSRLDVEPRWVKSAGTSHEEGILAYGLRSAGDGRSEQHPVSGPENGISRTGFQPSLVCGV
jgi:hypothetical protein